MFGVEFLACLRENDGAITASEIMNNSITIHTPNPAHTIPAFLAKGTRFFLHEHKMLCETTDTRSFLYEHKILHQKFVHYGANAKEWTRKCVLLLPEIERHRVWEQKKFGSIYEYAAKLAGMSRNTVDDALRILRKIEDKSALQKVVEEKGLNAVRPVVVVATPETAEFWAEKAVEMSKHTLEVYVADVRAGRGVNFRTGTGNTAENPQQQAISVFGGVGGAEASEPEAAAQQKTIVMQLDPEIADQLQKLKGRGEWNELMKELLQLRAAKLEEQKPEPLNTEARHIPAKIKKHVFARTNDTCSFPGCLRPAKILHHTPRFALEKSHDPDRLEPLCKAHERIAHHGLVQYEDLSARRWSVQAQPDKTAPKYQIDMLVGKYRNYSARLATG